MTGRLLGVAVALVLGLGAATAAPVGQFSEHQDIGKPKHPGAASYDAAAKKYRITGGGQNMWAARDDFHYAWKKMSGDVRATTDLVFVSPTPPPGAPGEIHRKGGIVLRQDLGTDSAYVDALRMGNQQMSLQYRETKGGPTHLIWVNTSRQDRVRLEKIGDYVFLSVLGADGKLRNAGGSFKLKLTGAYYIGLGVCPHDDNVTETMDFSSVTITPAAKLPAGAQSTLQTMQVNNPWEQTTVVHARGALQSPTWSADGKSFVYGKDDRFYRVAADGGEPSIVPDATLASGTGISADRRWVYFSDKSKIWRAHPDGSGRTQVTSNPETRDWSAHPSPDGKWLLYVSARADAPPSSNTDVEVRLAAMVDGAPDTAKALTMARLYGGQDTLALQPWSPDSKRLAFVGAH